MSPTATATVARSGDSITLNAVPCDVATVTPRAGRGIWYQRNRWKNCIERRCVFARRRSVATSQRQRGEAGGLQRHRHGRVHREAGDRHFHELRDPDPVARGALGRSSRSLDGHPQKDDAPPPAWSREPRTVAASRIPSLRSCPPSRDAAGCPRQPVRSQVRRRCSTSSSAHRSVALGWQGKVLPLLAAESSYRRPPKCEGPRRCFPLRNREIVDGSAAPRAGSTEAPESPASRVPVSCLVSTEAGRCWE